MRIMLARDFLDGQNLEIFNGIVFSVQVFVVHAVTLRHTAGKFFPNVRMH